MVGGKAQVGRDPCSGDGCQETKHDGSSARIHDGYSKGRLTMALASVFFGNPRWPMNRQAFPLPFPENPPGYMGSGSAQERSFRRGDQSTLSFLSRSAV